MRNSVVFGCALLGGVLSSGAANAQFFDFQARAAHSAYAPGMPETFTARATQSNGQPTAFGPVSVTQYSLEGFFANGAPANGVTIPSTTPIQAILANNPNVRLYPGDAARTSEFRLSIESVDRFEDAVFENFGDELLDECKLNVGFNDRVGLPLDATVRACDSLDATLSLNGVRFQLTGGEDQVPMRLVIPAVAFDFTASFPLASANPNQPFVTREDAIEQIDDAFFASGKAQALSARLLGQPDSFVIPRGQLPNEGTLLTGSVTVGAVTKTFAVDTPAQVLAYAIANRRSTFSDFGLTYDNGCFRSAGVVSGACSAASANLRIAGVEVTATVPANSTDVTFTIPEFGLSFTSANAEERDDALEQFLDYADANVDRQDLSRAYARYLAETDLTNPLVGNPVSAQGQLIRQGLDLDSPSEALDESSGGASGGPRPDDPSGWMVGGRVGYLETFGQGAEFVDAVAERGFRFKEGSRARLKVSMPLSYIHYGGRAAGGETGAVGLRGALEMPLIDGRWVVEPSAAVSGFYSSGVVSSGALYAIGLSSRYKIAPVGRGHLVIGNAVTHSSTLEIESGRFAAPKITNTAVRNGVAYQVPIGRVLQRQGTLRASYTYTYIFGDEIALDEYHEVSLNYGVAAREASVRQLSETLRFGVNGAFGRHFTAVALTAGYKF